MRLEEPLGQLSRLVTLPCCTCAEDPGCLALGCQRATWEGALVLVERSEGRSRAPRRELPLCLAEQLGLPLQIVRGRGSWEG